MKRVSTFFLHLKGREIRASSVRRKAARTAFLTFAELGYSLKEKESGKDYFFIGLPLFTRSVNSEWGFSLRRNGEKNKRFWVVAWNNKRVSHKQQTGS